MSRFFRQIIAVVLVGLIVPNQPLLSTYTQRSVSISFLSASQATVFDDQSLSFLLAFFPKPHRKLTALIFHRIGSQGQNRRGLINRLTTFAIESNVPLLSYGMGWLLFNRAQTTETTKILGEVKKALLDLHD